jgi:hypothetical protein
MIPKNNYFELIKKDNFIYYNLSIKICPNRQNNVDTQIDFKNTSTIHGL